MKSERAFTEGQIGRWADELTEVDRLEIAVRAMQGFLASGDPNDLRDVATAAFEMADAMIAEARRAREKHNP